LLVPGETWPTGLFPDVPRFEWPPVSEKSPGVLRVVVLGEVGLVPVSPAVPAAVPVELPAPPPLSAANAQPEVMAIAVARMIVVVFMTSVSLFMVE
jgi:hypothetical protein